MNEMEKSLLVRVLRVLGTQGTEPARPGVDWLVSGNQQDEVCQTEEEEQ